jgi:hypothetical protein
MTMYILEILHIVFEIPVALTCCDMLFKEAYGRELKFKQEVLEVNKPPAFLTFYRPKAKIRYFTLLNHGITQKSLTVFVPT